MPQHDIIVIGASAGGLEPLLEIIEGFPPDLPAAVFVVVHLMPTSRSMLPQILGRRCRLDVHRAQDGEPIEKGCIYVAPPDQHLMLRDGHVHLNTGPRENHTRPAIDPLFRSAARAYGPRVAAVVLSGALDDGSVGLLVVKSYGGVGLAQEPAEALIPSMPLAAIEANGVDYVLPAKEIAAQLTRLAQSSSEPEGGQPMPTQADPVTEMIEQDIREQVQDARHGRVSVYSCPDCGGVMWQADEGGLVNFSCHTGHRFTSAALLVQQSEELETALWSAIRGMREKSTLIRQMAVRARQGGDTANADRLDEQARIDEHNMELIRTMLVDSRISLVSEPAEIESEVRQASRPMRSAPQPDRGSKEMAGGESTA